MTSSPFQTLKELRTFLIVWFGQFVSLIGSSMTRFALIIWIYTQTGDALDLALLGFFSYGGYALASLFSGVLVDRYDRKIIMLLSDTGAGISTVILLALFATGELQLWHLFVSQAVSGLLEALQVPAYSAATTLMIPKKHYSRGSGLVSFAQYGAEVLAPFLAGGVLVVIGIEGVMLLDIVTFLVAVITLVFVKIPKPKPIENSNKLSHWQSLTLGARYVFERKGLLGVMLIFLGIGFFASLTYFSILPAMILARTGGDELVLATVQSALGLAGVIGGLILSVWGGPKKLIHGFLIATALSFLIADTLFAVGRNIQDWMLAAFSAAIFIPFIDGAYRALWQKKVDPALQGRVFAFRNMLTMSIRPFGFLMGGWLADNVFEPAMMPDGTLAPILGDIVGTGTGAGMASMFLFTAIGGMLISLSGYLIPAIRNVERDLLDFDESLESD
jgi:MFS transporter, DHA3 family, macrolide efflux protein